MSAEAIAKILKEKPKDQVTGAINEVLVKDGQPADGFNTLLDPSDRNTKLLAIALDNGKLVEFLNTDITGELNQPQVIVLADSTLKGKGGSFEDFMECKKMEGKELKVSDSVPGQDKLTLLDTASIHNQLVEFITHAKGVADLGILVECGENQIVGLRTAEGADKGKVSLGSMLLAKGDFGKVPQEKLTGVINIGDKHEGALYLYHAIQGGGAEQFDALLGSGKMVGMMQDFREVVHEDLYRIYYEDGEAVKTHKFDYELIVWAAKNNLLQKFLEAMVGYPENPASCNLELVPGNLSNNLNLGALVNPEAIILGQELQMIMDKLKFPEADQMLGWFFEHGKLEINFIGPTINRGIAKLQESRLKEGLYWKAECLNRNDIKDGQMAVHFTILSGAPDGENKGKLAFTVKLDKLWQFYEEICAAQKPPLDPASMDNLLAIKPVSEIELVSPEWLAENVPELDPGTARGFLGEHIFDCDSTASF